MAPRERIVIVSNRGPVTFSRSEAGERTYSRSRRPRHSPERGLAPRRGTVWIASAQNEEDVRVAREEPVPYEVEDLRVALVEHDPEAYDLMYNTWPTRSSGSSSTVSTISPTRLGSATTRDEPGRRATYP